MASYNSNKKRAKTLVMVIQMDIRKWNNVKFSLKMFVWSGKMKEEITSI